MDVLEMLKAEKKIVFLKITKEERGQQVSYSPLIYQIPV